MYARMIRVPFFVQSSLSFIVGYLGLSYSPPVCGRIHRIGVAMRGLIGGFEGVEHLDPSLLLTAVFEMDPLSLSLQGRLLPLCEVPRSIES